MRNIEELSNKSHTVQDEKLAAQFTLGLAETAKQRGGRNNKAFLLANWDKISAALCAGWNMRAIWDYLHSNGQFPGGYNTFVRCVRLEQSKLNVSALKTPAAEATASKSTQSTKSIRSGIDGFVYSPDVNTDNLI